MRQFYAMNQARIGQTPSGELFTSEKSQNARAKIRVPFGQAGKGHTDCAGAVGSPLQGMGYHLDAKICSNYCVVINIRMACVFPLHLYITSTGIRQPWKGINI